MSILSSFSRFKNSQAIIHGGNETYGAMSKFQFQNVDELSDDEKIKFVVSGRFSGRPDLIANEVYGQAFLEWVIVLCNPTENPLNWPQVGQTLTLPTPSIVFSEL